MEIKVLLIEDRQVVRQGIKELLQNNKEILLIGEASNSAQAIEKIKHQLPDVVLLDMNMPVLSGLECTKVVKQNFPKVKILVLSMYDQENNMSEFLKAGADGYILINSWKEELLFAIRKITSGGTYTGSEFTVNIVSKLKMGQDGTDGSNGSNGRAKFDGRERFDGVGGKDGLDGKKVDLSDREQDVLHLIADGLTNAEIAEKLFTSIRTIETRRKRLLEKTGTSNTATLIRFAVKTGLVS